MLSPLPKGPGTLQGDIEAWSSLVTFSLVVKEDQPQRCVEMCGDDAFVGCYPASVSWRSLYCTI